MEGSSKGADPVTIHVDGSEYTLQAGQRISVAIGQRTGSA